ncbi:hypothetical protein GJ689_15010 [Rhodoplanes serenus]|uniref:Uncharacterized protein n=1 Tax=Rhodoplanes serenus TaxID=200615 RepID=A0A9X4XLR0_9BRAD|nr:hypothetical protein [Rhodoplanes serenus]MTW17513.1 hypothetical protein [Rhodoplanes serenus]
MTSHPLSETAGPAISPSGRMATPPNRPEAAAPAQPTAAGGGSGSGSGIGRRAGLVVAALAAVLIAGTLGLWALWGPAVFYEVILAGIAACF